MWYIINFNYIISVLLLVNILRLEWRGLLSRLCFLFRLWVFPWIIFIWTYKISRGREMESNTRECKKYLSPSKITYLNFNYMLTYIITTYNIRHNYICETAQVLSVFYIIPRWIVILFAWFQRMCLLAFLPYFVNQLVLWV